MKPLHTILNRERIFWILVNVALITVVLLVLNSNRAHESRLAEAQQREETLLVRIEFLKESVEKAQSLAAFEQGKAKPYPKLYEWELKRLKEKGLDDPVNDLIADLREHPELIQYKGVLGGQMGFYYPRQIRVMNPRWVIASFDDGHIGGDMLLEYEVSPGGKISWKVVDSFLK